MPGGWVAIVYIGKGPPRRPQRERGWEQTPGWWNIHVEPKTWLIGILNILELLYILAWKKNRCFWKTDSFGEASGYDTWEQNLGAGKTTEGHLVQPPTHCLSQWPALSCVWFVQLDGMSLRSLFWGWHHFSFQLMKGFPKEKNKQTCLCKAWLPFFFFFLQF